MKQMIFAPSEAAGKIRIWNLLTTAGDTSNTPLWLDVQRCGTAQSSPDLPGQHRFVP